MTEILTQLTIFGADNIFGALGIDWQMLVFQIIGFVVLVWLMAKFVYPPLMKTVDKRQEQIEAANRAAKEAEAKSAETAAEVKRLLVEARREATEIVATAKEEATNLASETQAKSQAEAERIVSAAEESILKQVAAAKRALHNETIDLVAMATEKVAGKVVSDKLDSGVIESSLETIKGAK